MSLVLWPTLSYKTIAGLLLLNLKKGKKTKKDLFYNVNKWIHYEVSFLLLYLNADRLGFEPRPYRLTVYCINHCAICPKNKRGNTKIGMYTWGCVNK